MADAHKNFAVSAVATAPSPASSGTSLVVTGGHGTRFPAVPFNATVWPAGALPDPLNAEVVRVTAIATDTFTITRAQEGSSARTVVVGDLIAATITAKTLEDVEAGPIVPWMPAFTHVPGSIAAGLAAGTYTFAVDGGTRASAVATTSPVILIPIVAADWAVAGKTTMLKTRMVLQTNATAPTINFTAGLHSVTAVAGGANSTSTSFGAAVAGTTVTRSAPAASSHFVDDSAEYTIPADGRYVLAVLTSGAMPATNPRVHVQLSLLMRHV